jgi:hypothetical protein
MRVVPPLRRHMGSAAALIRQFTRINRATNKDIQRRRRARPASKAFPPLGHRRARAVAELHMILPGKRTAAGGLAAWRCVLLCVCAIIALPGPAGGQQAQLQPTITSISPSTGGTSGGTT